MGINGNRAVWRDFFAVRNAKDGIAAKARRTPEKTRRTCKDPPVDEAGFRF
jgi:hypothetical protein